MPCAESRGRHTCTRRTPRVRTRKKVERVRARVVRRLSRARPGGRSIVVSCARNVVYVRKTIARSVNCKLSAGSPGETGPYVNSPTARAAVRLCNFTSHLLGIVVAPVTGGNPISPTPTHTPPSSHQASDRIPFEWFFFFFCSLSLLFIPARNATTRKNISLVRTP